jgi:hypothetical protein
MVPLHNKVALAKAQDLLIDHLFQAFVGCDTGILLPHHFRDFVVSQRVGHCLLLHLGRDGVLYEPTDKGDPQAGFHSTRW